MIKRDPERNRPWANGMPPGPSNPLGPRALYLFQEAGTPCTGSTAPPSPTPSARPYRGLHPHAQPGHPRPVQPRPGRNPGGRPPGLANGRCRYGAIDVTPTSSWVCPRIAQWLLWPMALPAGLCHSFHRACTETITTSNIEGHPCGDTSSLVLELYCWASPPPATHSVRRTRARSTGIGCESWRPQPEPSGDLQA